ncbi:MAG TPA: hypothetical protein VFF73_25530, partial [Planctomycetota bacterium]|nr:hypothetical protein [Planctomycetota bacterium]
LLHVVDLLRPKWLVLRTPEVAKLAREFPGAASHYSIVGEPFTDPAPPAIEWGGLRNDLAGFDRQFFLLHRNE